MGILNLVIGKPVKKQTTEELLGKYRSREFDKADSLKTTPAESSIKKVATPAESSIKKVTTPVESSIKKVATPVESSIKKVTTPVESSIKKVTAPVESSIKKVATPVESSIKKVTTPAESSIRKAVTPVESSIKKVTKPVETGIRKITTQVEIGNRKVTTPVSKPMDLGMGSVVSSLPRDVASASLVPTIVAFDESALRRIDRYGASIWVDVAGNILKTCDVLGVEREFARDKFTGQLMVKRFRIWTKPCDAQLDEDGTLSFVRDGVLIAERLNGVHIHLHQETGAKIITHPKKGLEFEVKNTGEITKRQSSKENETFQRWQKDQSQPAFSCEVYYSPRRDFASTVHGKQPLVFVARIERLQVGVGIVQEKFTFRNVINGKRSVTLSLPIGNGLLMLKGVMSLTTAYVNDVPTESTYEFEKPTGVRVDLPAYRGNLEQITQVRVFNGSDLSLAFKNAAGSEQIVIPDRSVVSSSDESSQKDNLTVVAVPLTGIAVH